MNFTNEQRDKMLKELNSPTVHLCCEDHGFYPGKVTSLPMQFNCKYCTLAQFYYEFAKTPPHMRQQRLDELESLVHHMVEDLERGNFDISVFDHPQVTIEKDASS